MSKIEIAERPDFSVEVEAFTTETPAHADNFNEKYHRFLNNEKHLKNELLNAGIDSSEKNTVFNNDGSITETTESYTNTTVFNDDGSITETKVFADETTITKTTTFNEDGSITEVFE